MVSVRPATPSDLPALLPLVADYWRFEALPGFETEQVTTALRRLLTNPRLGSGWIAEVEGTAVGYLLAVYVFSLEHLGVTAEIDEFFVAASQRGQRVGAALLQTAEAAFRDAGCTNVSLQLARDNHAARAFYHRHGFAERPSYELLEKTLRSERS